MPSGEIRSIVVDAHEVFCAENEFLEVRVVPRLGGRIISLEDRQSGRDWVWHPDGSPNLVPRIAGSSFEESGHGGIDECLPTVGACSWNGRELPDHGEIWTTAGDIDRNFLECGKIRIRLPLQGSPFAFERTIALSGPEIQLSYRLYNRGAQSEPFLWAWHPLFSIRPGDRLELPTEARTLAIESAQGTRNAARGTHWQLPAPVPDVDFRSMTLGSGESACVKGFVGPLGEAAASVRLRGAGGESLSMTWQPGKNPYLGLWLSRGYRGWHHIALEPCNCPSDSLREAIEEGKPHRMIKPGETLEWTVTVVTNR